MAYPDICESYLVKGAIGLKLTLPDGVEVIKTTTHSFVKLMPHPNAIYKCIASINKRASEALSKPPSNNSQQSQVSRIKIFSPLNREVWLVGTKQKVSSITYYRYL
jgi:hypothetical protein